MSAQSGGDGETVRWSVHGRGTQKDDSSLFDDHTSNGTRRLVETPNKSDPAALALANAESIRVSRWQFGVIAMFGTVCAVVFGVTNLLYSRYETAEFRSSYEKSILLIIDSFQSSAETVEDTFEAVADNVATQIRITNQTWPLVMVEDFEIMAGHARTSSMTEAVFLVPLVYRQNREEWEEFVHTKTDWLDESREYEPTTSAWLQEQDYYQRNEKVNSSAATDDELVPEMFVKLEKQTLIPGLDQEVSREIFALNDNTLSCLETPPCHLKRESPKTIYGPVWQVSPPPQDPFVINYNLFSDPNFSHIVSTLITTSQRSMMTGFFDVRLLYSGLFSEAFHRGYHSDDNAEFQHKDKPHSLLVSSVYTDVSKSSHIVGMVAAVIPYSDEHDSAFDYTLERVEINVHGSAATFKGSCGYTLELYATKGFMDQTRLRKQRFLLLIALTVLFAVTGSVFFVYIRFVQQRQVNVLEKVLRSNALVASVFPDRVCERLLGDEPPSLGTPLRHTQAAPPPGLPQGVARPIADLYPSATVIMCDLQGFSAWGSAREPSDVFYLLETVFGAFDKLAKKRNVFKVETSGDKYVACAGVPEPDEKHALTCCRFAIDCQSEFFRLVKTLESTFGPDTCDLSIRIGIHTGPITAGLFGNTVTLTDKMESTCSPGLIQVSKEVAGILKSAGKNNWVKPRIDKVIVNGRGAMDTFWLKTPPKRDRGKRFGRLEASPSFEEIPNKTNRLLDWHVDKLSQLLRAVEARRRVLGVTHRHFTATCNGQIEGEATILDEVAEIITLPKFERDAALVGEILPESIELNAHVVGELRDFVSTIALLYRENPFHSFEHASHVVMSVTKLLSRIVAPSTLFNETTTSFGARAHELHDHTYGITSDPLTQFACLFSALIHDVDHRGIGNPQLGVENPQLHQKYRGKAIAEQNSVDLAWSVLLQDKYSNLQKAIFATEDEYSRFRQLVVNSVMATDIMDQDLKEKRNHKWNRAFKTAASGPNDENMEDATNRKATIVIEFLIQASDVSHTMQHWHIYRKWNYRLFKEMYAAFQKGRSSFNPVDGWATGEIGFFDFYIIPLAKKLQSCGVFGVSSFEYLDYALRNRDEWASKGQEVVEEYLELIKKEEELEPPQQESPVADELEWNFSTQNLGDKQSFTSRQGNDSMTLSECLPEAHRATATKKEGETDTEMDFSTRSAAIQSVPKSHEQPETMGDDSLCGETVEVSKGNGAARDLNTQKTHMSSEIVQTTACDGAKTLSLESAINSKVPRVSSDEMGMLLQSDGYDASVSEVTLQDANTEDEIAQVADTCAVVDVNESSLYFC